MNQPSASAATVGTPPVRSSDRLLTAAIIKQSCAQSWKHGSGFATVIGHAVFPKHRHVAVVARTTSGRVVFCLVLVRASDDMEFTDLTGQQPKPFRAAVFAGAKPQVEVYGTEIVFTAGTERWTYQLQY